MITFCINTARNELNYIKLLFKSLECNLSTRDHEIIVFIDSDNENTFEWLLTQKNTFPHLKILKNNLPICYGYARNINEMFTQASNEIVSYLQSDMVICKDYDLEILKKLEPNMILCSTRIEPPLHGPANEVLINNFGLSPSEFNFDAFVDFANKNKQDKVTEYFFAPFTLYKDVWLSIGGHDTLFRRSREDSDILTRLVLNDTKIIQVWNALVYHFTCTSSRGSEWFNKQNTKAQERVQLQQSADMIELGRFVTKWGGFNHSLTKQKHYNITAYITGTNLDLANFAFIQSYFYKVFVDDEPIITLMQEWYDRMHQPANQLLNITNEDWNTYGYMYNKSTASDRIKPINQFDGADIVVKFDLKNVTPQLHQEFIQNIQHIIENVDDVGDFEYGPFSITIYQLVDRASECVVITNPEIKPNHLYTTH
jgi:glycosyltransferase involved in cell wall biosynthesis